MLKYILQPLILFLFLTHVSMVQAVEVSQLDSVSVPVDSRSDSDKTKALRQALENVILKNSGSRDALTNPQVKAQLANAETLVSQFGYTNDDNGLKLTAQFDQNQITMLLREAGLPVWGKQRPLTLFWLALESDGEWSILNDNADIGAEARQAMLYTSTERGVPVLFPIMDLDDSMLVNVNDVKGQFVNPIASASNRYQADFFVVGQLQQSATRVNYQLSLYPKTVDETDFIKPLFNQEGSTVTIEEALSEMMLLLSDHYVSLYAITDSGNNNISQISFSAISQIKQVVEIENFLNKLSVVKQAYVKQISGNDAIFEVQLFGTEDDLKNMLDLAPQLIKPSVSQVNYDYSSPTMNGETSNTLAKPSVIGPYQWRID